jgi:hypothetical protein
VLVSVLLGHSEPKYLAVDECALGFRSSEIVGLVMLQKWLQNMAVQKPVAATIVAVPTPPPTHSRGGTLNGSKRGVELTISNQKEVSRSQGPLRVGSSVLTLDLSNLAFRKRKGAWDFELNFLNILLQAQLPSSNLFSLTKE